MIDAAVDADPVKPGRKACSFLKVKFIQGIVGFDECFLENVLGIFGVSDILVSQGKDPFPIFIKQLSQCLSAENSGFISLNNYFDGRDSCLFDFAE